MHQLIKYNIILKLLTEIECSFMYTATFTLSAEYFFHYWVKYKYSLL